MPKKVVKTSVTGSSEHKLNKNVRETPIVGESVETELSEPIKMGKVYYGVSRTVNLGNYESVKINVGLEMPFELGGGNKAYKKAKEVVDAKIEEEVGRWTHDE